MRNRISPALLLYFLAPLIGEVLSGSLPPTKLLHPVTLIFITALYGSGAILCRELMIRWNKGWPTLLTLGLAYGIIEEGLLTKSFFDPSWPALGPLAIYGRWLDVNWVWAVQQTIFHAAFSVGIPVLLVNLLYPRQRSFPWITSRSFNRIALLLTAIVLLGFLLVGSYRPPLICYVLTVLIVAALVFFAQRLPRTIQIRSVPYIASTLRFGLLSFFATLMFFLLRWLLPYTPVPAYAAIFLTEALAFLAVRTALRFANPVIGGWSELQLLSLASGALTFFIVLAPLQEEFAQGRDTSGMLIVALVATALLIWLVWHVRSRNIQ